MKLSGKNALVTGGGLRLGKAVSEALASEGANVVIHYRSSRSEAEETLARLEAAGGSGCLVQGSLDTEEEANSLFDAATEAAGPIHILVNNAARFSRDTLKTVTGHALTAEMWPNLFSPMLLMKRMALSKVQGSIVNILDRRVSTGDGYRVPYLLSKKGLLEMTRVAAREFAPAIRVNAVAPGPILPPPGKDEAHLEAHAGPVPLACRITPGHVAEAVMFFVLSEVYTGQVLYVDGGQHLLGEESWSG